MVNIQFRFYLITANDKGACTIIVCCAAAASRVTQASAPVHRGAISIDRSAVTIHGQTAVNSNNRSSVKDCSLVPPVEKNGKIDYNKSEIQQFLRLAGQSPDTPENL